MKRLHALISGRVQGVFFRANTIETARALGVKGWVRNLADGRVELIAEGEESALNELLQWLYQGPEGSLVQEVKYKWLKPTGEFKEFSRKQSL